MMLRMMCATPQAFPATNVGRVFIGTPRIACAVQAQRKAGNTRRNVCSKTSLGIAALSGAIGHVH